MTPERLDEVTRWFVGARTAERTFHGAEGDKTRMVGELIEYIDLLHEDLRITRQERDHAKHQALEHRKRAATAERERDEYRKGQGRAPAEQGPGTDALHHTHPIPNSRGDDQ